ncbi:hypothetical protein V497_08382, partial [Pseudogymnoascus sp. VKM F-4516 (FW-969)]
MTLFGNILQNPQDPRARSDVRLMNLVVNFLSMLAGEDENTGVKRMLGVCSEFERIARVVLDKADKDTTTRRKRKELNEVLPSLSVSRPPIQRPATSTSNGQTPPQFQAGGYDVNAYSTGADGGGGVPAQDLSWMSDQSFHDIATDFEQLSNSAAAAAATAAANGGGGGVGVPFPDMSRYLSSTDPHSPINPQSFQQPFVPPDLWNMPMTLEWDWADLTG